MSSAEFLTSRAAEIEQQMLAVLDELDHQIDMTPFPILEWNHYCDDHDITDLDRVRGWLDFDPRTDTVLFCPVAMAAVSSPAESVETYVDLVLQIVLYEITTADQFEDDRQRRIAAEEALADLTPDGVVFLFRLHALAVEDYAGAEREVAGDDAWAREAFGPQFDRWS